MRASGVDLSENRLTSRGGWQGGSLRCQIDMPARSGLHNGSEAVGRAPDPVGATLRNVGVDHRYLQVAVAEEFLDGADQSGWRAGGTQVSAITDSV